MREIDYGGRFKRDLRRELRGRFGASLEALLEPIVDDLLNDRPLAARLRDHALTGKLSSMRDCHVRSDLVLIYSVADPGVLKLVRLGSHSELGIG